MMKKVLLVVLCLMLAASVSMAQTSGPSNVAGYVKISCPGNAALVPYATAFGLPFKFWDVVGGVPQYGVESTKPSDIVGSQANPGSSDAGDKIVRQDGGFSAYYATGGVWTGNLEDNSEMRPGKAYWFINKAGALRNLVFAGEVDNAGNYGTAAITQAGVAGGNYATAYSWRDSRNVPVESLGLLEAGFTGGSTDFSDKVVAQVGGTALLYRTDLVPPGWDFGGVGEPFHYVVPGKAYWIVNKHTTSWNYTYVGVPVLPSTMRGHEGVITSKTRTSSDTQKGTVRATTSVKKNTSSKSGSKVQTNK